MRKNKIIFMALIFLVSLLCISAASAADDAASDIVANTNDVTVLEESIDDAVLSDSQDEENVLSEDKDSSEPLTGPQLRGNFTALYEDINNGKDTVELNADYLYNGEEYSGWGVSIDRNLTVYGNGHYIDGDGKSRIFRIYASNVTFHDIIFMNAYDDSSSAKGAAIEGSATAINCTFIGNRVEGSTSKGAAMAEGTAVNCTFINNTASFGGALYGGTAFNCTFSHNKAENWGGATREINAIGCLFIANHAGGSGGATYQGVSRNCTYLSNTAGADKDYHETSIYDCIFADSATLSVADFITAPDSGEKQMINLTSDDGKNLSNVPVTVKITKDDEEIGTYSGLSGDGWAVNLAPGTYDAEFSVDYTSVEKQSCKILVASETSFRALDYLLNKKYLENSTIYLDNDYKYIADYDSVLGLNNGISIYRNLTIEGNGHKIDGSQLARLFWVKPDAVVTFKNIVLANGFGNFNGNGGAIWAEDSTVKAIKCNFINNSARHGGAIAYGDAEDCNFTSNQANGYFQSCGGAIYEGNAVNCLFESNGAIYHGGALYESNATNSTFIDNSAEVGGAIADGNAVNSTFIGNRADDGGAIAFGNATGCIFERNKAEDSGGAMTAWKDNIAVNCTFNNNSACENGGALYRVDAVNCSFNGNKVTEGEGSAMYGDEEDEAPCHAVNCIFTNNNAGGKKAIFGGTADSCIFNGGDAPDEGVVIKQPVLKDFNFISTYNDGSILDVKISSSDGMPIANARIKADIYTPTGTLVATYNITSGGWKVPLNAGTYLATYNATDFDNVTSQGVIIVNKENSTIKSSAVSTVYNKNKYLVITLKDSKGNPISGAKVTVTLASAKTYTTDKNGQIKINIAKVVPKAYTAKISFAGNTNYATSSTSAKVTVKKAAVKMTAKKKTFKVKVKTKKYTITLKNNVKKAIKGAKVTLKVNKKTFKAKTNKNGKAVFKIKNLKKKGTYKAVIKFAGNKYYKKVTKKVKIKVKK